MRLGGANEFDVTDSPEMPIDTLDGALDCAVTVLQDYGGCAGTTRVERLSRWMVARLGGEPHGVSASAGSIARFDVVGSHRVVRVGGLVGVEFAGADQTLPHGGMLAAGARSMAVALLRAAELADQ